MTAKSPARIHYLRTFSAVSVSAVPTVTSTPCRRAVHATSEDFAPFAMMLSIMGTGAGDTRERVTLKGEARMIYRAIAFCIMLQKD